MSSDTSGPRRPERPKHIQSFNGKIIGRAVHDADHGQRTLLGGSSVSQERTDASQSTKESRETSFDRLSEFTSEIIGKLSALRSVASVIAASNESITRLYDEIGRLRVWLSTLDLLVFRTPSLKNMPGTIGVALEDLNMLADRGNSAFFLNVCNCRV